MKIQNAQRRTFAMMLALAAPAAASISAMAQTPPATTAPPAATAPPTTAASTATTASTGDPRLERLATELERARIDQHAPGVAVAVVRGGELIFARGFGMANVADKIAVTPETRFFIGSSTKAFTATLVGMLVDEGKMNWDDPVDQHLPYFKLAVKSDDPAARATLRDLLCHRTGFPRMHMLSAGGVLTSEEVLRQASEAEPLSSFRQKFHYSNEQYMAAGLAAAAAAGRPWDELIRARILEPLGMTATEITVRRGSAMSDLAHGYDWHKETGELEDLQPKMRHWINNVDTIGPAGSISSTAPDMAKWLRFLLAKGEVNGKPLIKAETLGETWNKQIAINASVGYGMGWMLQEWRGQPMIQHGGSLPGYSTMVALLPKSELGIVVLVNQNGSTLGDLAANLVPSILLGDASQEAGQDAGDVSPYLGRYVANFGAFSNEIFTVQAREGSLALDIPSQRVYALNPPDEKGRWQFALTDQIAVSFRRNKAGEVVALNMYQQGMTFEAMREGVEEEPEIDLALLQKYLGNFRADSGLDITTFVQNQRLAIRVRGTTVFDLHPPDAEGRRATRANAQIAVAFDESDKGEVTGLRFFRPGVPVLKLAAATRDTPALPTVEDLLALRAGSQQEQKSARTSRTTGTIRYPQAAVKGRFEIVSAGDDRLRIDIDLGRNGRMHTAMNGEAGGADTFGTFTEIRGERLEQIRLFSNPSVLFGDWRRHYDSVTVLREDKVNGTPAYAVELRKKGSPKVTLGVDAKTGDILGLTTTLNMAALGSLPTTMKFEDYREVEGVRLPFRQVESNEASGRTVYEVERVEFDVEVDDALFNLRPAESRP